jgi:hypothetical protein
VLRNIERSRAPPLQVVVPGNLTAAISRAFAA